MESGKPKVLIIGNGYIGNRIGGELNYKILVGKIKKFSDVEKFSVNIKPDVVINCAGFVGKNNTDGCEDDIDNTIQANTFVPFLLAEGMVRFNYRLIHISTGCMFGRNPAMGAVTEMEGPDYTDLFYSRSKVYAERGLLYLTEKFPLLMLRIRIPLDYIPHSKNLLTKLINYRKVIDIQNSVTYLPDFITMLKWMVERRPHATGVYNATNFGGLYYPLLMDAYKKYHPEYEYEIYDRKEFAKDKNRTNLVMSVQKLSALGWQMRSIEAVIPECVREYVKQEAQ